MKPRIPLTGLTIALAIAMTASCGSSTQSQVGTAAGSALATSTPRQSPAPTGYDSTTSMIRGSAPIETAVHSTRPRQPCEPPSTRILQGLRAQSYAVVHARLHGRTVRTIPVPEPNNSVFNEPFTTHDITILDTYSSDGPVPTETHIGDAGDDLLPDGEYVLFLLGPREPFAITNGLEGTLSIKNNQVHMLCIDYDQPDSLTVVPVSPPQALQDLEATLRSNPNAPGTKPTSQGTIPVS